MTRAEISQAIIDIGNETVPDEDWSALKPEENLCGKLESIDFLDVVMDLRKQYGVEVPEADYGALSTLQSCVDYREPRLTGK